MRDPVTTTSSTNVVPSRSEGASEALFASDSNAVATEPPVAASANTPARNTGVFIFVAIIQLPAPALRRGGHRGGAEPSAAGQPATEGSGRRRVEVTERRTRVDWARLVRDLVDGDYPDRRVVLVMDNLNTQTPASDRRRRPTDEPIGPKRPASGLLG